jgi:hypothetical protein
MFGKYNGFVSKARVSACMYFLVIDIKLPTAVILLILILRASPGADYTHIQTVFI